MANLALVRIDNRLIHGQIATQWVTFHHVTQIVVIDDVSYNDPFLNKLLVLAAPKGTKVKVVTAQMAGDLWKANQFGSEPTLAVIKDIKTAVAAYEAGFEFPILQVGGAISKPGSVTAFKTVYLDAEDAKMLTELCNKGVNVEFKCQLYDSTATWSDLRDKVYKQLNLPLSQI